MVNVKFVLWKVYNILVYLLMVLTILHVTSMVELYAMRSAMVELVLLAYIMYMAGYVHRQR